MEVKVATVVLLAMILMVNVVVADFFFNHPSPKAEDIDGIRYKCVPGRTIIKVTEKQVEIEETDSEEYRLRKGPTRRNHKAMPSQDENCRICVCPAEGKDEYCIHRPTQNINECMMLRDISVKLDMGLPFEHTSNLANRIRRVNQVGNVRTEKKCVPFISEYSNCNEEKICTGCSRCKCDSDGQWECQDVKDCQDDDNNNSPDNNIQEDDDIFDNALQMLEFDVNKEREVKVSQSPYVPAPHAISEQEKLIGYLVAIPRQEH